MQTASAPYAKSESFKVLPELRSLLHLLESHRTPIGLQNPGQLKPPLHRPVTFHLGDELALVGSNEGVAFMVHPEYHSYYILTHLDDPAACRVLYAGVSLSAPPDTLWTNLSCLFDARPLSHVPQSSPMLNPLPNATMFHSHPPARKFAPYIRIHDGMYPDLGTVTTTEPVSQRNRTRGLPQAAHSNPDNEVDNKEKQLRGTEENARTQTLSDHYEEAANCRTEVGVGLIQIIVYAEVLRPIFTFKIMPTYRRATIETTVVKHLNTP
ncbi:hypothetical protein CSKR_101849 [Clonorchis sinensis]|uniref:Uncharacterized protein n=1 Tax=Clonorchis sinensis TaxID=79923 RepID=A0A3R7GRF7_CLOSI|nr:hypothetical protein CSKR_101849 [Clonorchis sinensis]